MKKGIDISVFQGEVDFEKVKNEVDFVIIRCGYGDDIESQDDRYFERNYSECVRLGIPFCVYFFTYALNTEKVSREISHIKRLLAGKQITGPVYIDVENTRGLNWRSISDDSLLDIMKEFNRQLNDLGYKMGIYSSRSAFWNEKMRDPWYDGISKWVAEYSDNVHDFNRSYDLWQYTSTGSVNGVNGNVDMNHIINDVLTPCYLKTNEDIAKEVLNGLWGNGEDRKNRLTEAGYNYDDVQNIVNLLVYSKPKKTNEDIAKEVLNGLWGNGDERINRLTEEGYNYHDVQEIVNNILSEQSKKTNDEIANEVLRGLWGNGDDRKKRILQAGYNYETIQSIVNKKIKRA